MEESPREEDLHSTARDPLVGVAALAKPALTAYPTDQALSGQIQLTTDVCEYLTSYA
jgi:hypothetical protein